MSKYIDAEDFFDTFPEIDKIPYSSWAVTHVADVRPVIKGKWEHMWGDEWCCSQCGNVISTEGSWEHPLSDECKMYYCNICGADMRGEQNEIN